MLLIRNSFLCLCILVVQTSLLHSQDNETGPPRFSPKELSIPASPVFDLMGVTPSQINRTTDIKDFKVDWSFKSWRLNPNLAIQSQPVWELFYNRKDLRKYQAASLFMRKLASLDVSIGTVQNEESDRRIGFAAKLNLYRQRDPLMAEGLYDDVGTSFAEQRAALESELAATRLKLDTTSNILDKPALREQMIALVTELQALNGKRIDEINRRAKIFVAENWNAASLDIAFGRVYTYASDSAGSLKKLRLNRNTGWGLWINGGFPIGKKLMISGLARATFYEEELSFLLTDDITLDQSEARALAANRLYTLGMNMRYGGAAYSFFAEFLYEKKSLETPVAALDKTFTAPSGFSVVSSSVQWAPVHPNTLSIGGDWRISRNLVINYGLRCVFSDSWKAETFTPIAGISCMMR